MGAGMAYSALPSADSAVEDNPAWDCQRVILAVFLGGCTFSEIAALRFLGKERGRSSLGRVGARGCPAASHAPCSVLRTGWGPRGRGWQCRRWHRRAFPAGCKFIFLTTAITNSARMMEAMIEAKA